MKIKLAHFVLFYKNSGVFSENSGNRALKWPFFWVLTETKKGINCKSWGVMKQVYWIDYVRRTYMLLTLGGTH